MKKFLYALFFLNFIITSNVVEASNVINVRCQAAAQRPNVRISFVSGEMLYDHTKVNRTLARLHEKEYGGQPYDGFQINGLSTYTLETEINFRIIKQVFNDGVTCFYPADIELIVSMKNPTIYIARALKKGTCAYNITLRHEQTHQQINFETLQAYLPYIKERFIKIIKKYALISRPKDDISLEKVQTGLQKRYSDAINAVIEEVKKEINLEQQKLDNLENYNYEQSLCKN